MKSNPQTKIQKLDPSSSNFTLYFQIAEIISKNSDAVQCRIVDDSGIVDAYFDRFGSKMQKGGVYLMTQLKCAVVNQRLRVQMSKNTVVSKEPEVVGFKDKTNDMSKKNFKSSNAQTPNPQNQSQSQNNKTQLQKGTIIQNKKKLETLIPFTKEEALEQLRQQKQFEEQLKKKQQAYLKIKQHKDAHKEAQHKQKDSNKHKQGENHKQKPVQYKQKQAQKTEVEQNQGRKYKAKSVIYKSKQEDNGKQKNNRKQQGNRKYHAK